MLLFFNRCCCCIFLLELFQKQNISAGSEECNESLKQSSHVHKWPIKTKWNLPFIGLQKRHTSTDLANHIAYKLQQTQAGAFLPSLHDIIFCSRGNFLNNVTNIGVSLTFGETESHKYDYGLETVEQVSVKTLKVT